MARTMLDLDDDLLARAARELGTTTKQDTVNAALRATLRAAATRALLDRLADNADGADDEAVVNEMWQQSSTPDRR